VTVLALLMLAAAVRLMPVAWGRHVKHRRVESLRGQAAGRAPSAKSGDPPGAAGLVGLDLGRPAVRGFIGGLASAAAVLLVQPDAVVVAGLLGAGAGLAIRWAARRSGPRRTGRSLGLTLCLHLWAAALAAGSAPAAGLRVALAAVEPLTTDDPDVALLGTAAAQLHLGADPLRVWRELGDNTGLGPIPAAAARSAVGGAELATVVDDHVRALDRADLATAQARAARGAVAMAGPLGLCFLPAFICLGLVPVVIALLATIDIGR
jgi:hypothetical protein